MGLKLSGMIEAREATRADLHGKTVGIDVPNLMYAFYGVHMRRAETDARRPNAVRAGIRGVLQRADDLTAWGARPVLILDGPPHPQKAELLTQRGTTRSFPALTTADYAPLLTEARAAG